MLHSCERMCPKPNQTRPHPFPTYLWRTLSTLDCRELFHCYLSKTAVRNISFSLERCNSKFKSRSKNQLHPKQDTESSIGRRYRVHYSGNYLFLHILSIVGPIKNHHKKGCVCSVSMQTPKLNPRISG